MDDSSGIKSVPNEVLARIFSAVANRKQNVEELPSPALLSSICRHWRMLAQNTPELWTNIMVPLHKSLEDCISWTAEWISRSGILLISVYIINPMKAEGRIGGPHLTKIMDLLSQHSKRLRHLAIHNFQSPMIESAFAQLQSAHNLQELTLCAYSISSFLVKHHSQHQYSLDFPRLAILKMQGPMIPLIPNLTSLTINKLYANYEETSLILTASPGLQHLILDNLLPLTGPYPQGTALIRVNSLCSLAVSFSSRPLVDRSIYIFKYLALPNIKYLELDGETWSESNFGQSLFSAEIDTLRISNRSRESFEADTIDFLHSFSTVRHLQLVHASTRGLLSKIKSPRGLARKTSINFRNPSSSRPTAPTNVDIIFTATPQKASASANMWPELRIITLDTLTAADVLNLCNFVNCHKHVQVVELSISARRHLSSSLHRKGDSVYERPSLFRTAGSEEGLNDVDEWLGKMVDIHTSSSPSVGLLDAD